MKLNDKENFVDDYIPTMEYLDSNIHMIRIYGINGRVVWGRTFRLDEYLSGLGEMKKIISKGNKKNWDFAQMRNTLDEFYKKREQVRD